MQKVFSRTRHGDTFTLYPDDAEHLTKVLRMGVGDLVLVNDDGKWIQGRIQSLTPFLIEALPDQQDTIGAPHLPLSVTLYQAVIKPKHFEWLVQKATEMGVQTIVPVQFGRSMSKNQERPERLALIAKNAGMQCGRSTLPTIAPTIAFNEMLQWFSEHDLILVPYENMAGLHSEDPFDRQPWQIVAKQLPKVKSVAIVVGPEGGFSLQEVAELREHPHTLLLGLTPTILRSETATIYTLSNLIRLILEENYAHPTAELSA